MSTRQIRRFMVQNNQRIPPDVDEEDDFEPAFTNTNYSFQDLKLLESPQRTKSTRKSRKKKKKLLSGLNSGGDSVPCELDAQGTGHESKSDHEAKSDACKNSDNKGNDGDVAASSHSHSVHSVAGVDAASHVNNSEGRSEIASVAQNSNAEEKAAYNVLASNVGAEVASNIYAFDNEIQAASIVEVNDEGTKGASYVEELDKEGEAASNVEKSHEGAKAAFNVEQSDHGTDAASNIKESDNEVETASNVADSDDVASDFEDSNDVASNVEELDGAAKAASNLCIGFEDSDDVASNVEDFDDVASNVEDSDDVASNVEDSDDVASNVDKLDGEAKEPSNYCINFEYGVDVASNVDKLEREAKQPSNYCINFEYAKGVAPDVGKVLREGKPPFDYCISLVYKEDVASNVDKLDGEAKPPSNFCIGFENSDDVASNVEDSDDVASNVENSDDVASNVDELNGKAKAASIVEDSGDVASDVEDSDDVASIIEDSDDVASNVDEFDGKAKAASKFEDSGDVASNVEDSDDVASNVEYSDDVASIIEDSDDVSSNVDDLDRKANAASNVEDSGDVASNVDESDRQANTASNVDIPDDGDDEEYYDSDDSVSLAFPLTPREISYQNGIPYAVIHDRWRPVPLRYRPPVPLDVENSNGEGEAAASICKSNDEDKGQEEVTSETKSDYQTNKKYKKKNKKNNNKKNNNKKNKKKNKKKSVNDSEDEVSRAVAEVNRLLGPPPGAPIRPPPPRLTLRHFLTISHRNLNPRAELDRLLGPDEEATPWEKKMHALNDKKRQIQVLDYSMNIKYHEFRMKHMETVRGIKYFKFEYGDNYESGLEVLMAQVKFYGDTLSIDKMIPIATLEAFLQLSDFYFKADEVRHAAGILEASIRHVQTLFDSSFSYFDGKSRLLYVHVENRPFLIMVLKYLYYLTNKACHRTALEMGKLLLSLDPSDPLALILVIDMLAVRARCHTWFLDAFDALAAERDASRLFHMLYSRALCQYRVHRKSKLPEDLELATKYLRNAVIMYPNVLIALLEHCFKNVKDIKTHELYTNAMMTTPKILLELQTFYCTFVSHRWSEGKHTLDWMEDTFKQVCQEYDDDMSHRGIKWRVGAAAVDRCSLFRKMPVQVKRHLAVIEAMSEFLVDNAVPKLEPTISFNPYPDQGESIDVNGYYADILG